HAAGRGLDLVLIDHVLPGRSGLELLRLSKQRWPWVPVVLITGFGSEDLVIQALRAGADDYLRKPVDVADLRQVALTCARAGSPVASIATSAASPERTHRGIRRALLFAQEPLAEPITLTQVAREAGLSKFHFCHLFRRQMGRSFRRYVQ